MKIFGRMEVKSDMGFYVFVSLVVGILVKIEGLPVMSAFLTGFFIYVFLRFCGFIWSMILKLLGVIHEKGQ